MSTIVVTKFPYSEPSIVAPKVPNKIILKIRNYNSTRPIFLIIQRFSFEVSYKILHIPQRSTEVPKVPEVPEKNMYKYVYVKNMLQ